MSDRELEEFERELDRQSNESTLLAVTLALVIIFCGFGVIVASKWISDEVSEEIQGEPLEESSRY